MGMRQSVPVVDTMEFTSTMLHEEIPTRSDTLYAPDTDAPPRFSLMPADAAVWSSMLVTPAGSNKDKDQGIVDAVWFADALVRRRHDEDPDQREAAEQGAIMGARYYEARDLDAAVECYREAAEQGDPRAQLWLGNACYDGEGVAKDPEAAARWYEAAAEQGCARAQVWLGRMLYDGDGVARDLERAAGWYQRAAEQGNARAQYALGCMYHYGEGVAKDPALSAQWYERSAAEDTAHLWLGHTYRNRDDYGHDDGDESASGASDASSASSASSDECGDETGDDDDGDKDKHEDEDCGGGWVSTIRAAARSLGVETARLYPPTFERVCQTVASGRAVVVGFSDDDESATYAAVVVGYTTAPVARMQIAAFRSSGCTVSYVDAGELPFMFSVRVVSPPSP